jgi:hypothetical protein
MFLKTTEVAQSLVLLFSTVNVVYISMGCAIFWVIFFTSSSGQPVPFFFRGKGKNIKTPFERRSVKLILNLNMYIKRRYAFEAGLPDFSDQKSQFGSILEGFRIENAGIFYGHLEYFTVICFYGR